jgi:hypothetical protein
MTTATETVTRERIEHAFGLVGKIVTAKVEAVAELRVLFESFESAIDDMAPELHVFGHAGVQALESFVRYLDEEVLADTENLLAEAQGVERLLHVAAGHEGPPFADDGASL